MKKQTIFYAYIPGLLTVFLAHANNDVYISDMVKVSVDPNKTTYGTIRTLNRIGDFFDFCETTKQLGHTHATMARVVGMIQPGQKITTKNLHLNTLLNGIMAEQELTNYNVTIKEHSLNENNLKSLTTALSLYNAHAKYNRVSLEISAQLNPDNIIASLKDLARLEQRPLKISRFRKFLLSWGIGELPNNVRRERDDDLEIIKANLVTGQSTF
ncbi:hypothetical protein KJZ61_00690 [Candidatus Dependentiae bacterium]|nr:hypothetical protein [Candidatus Dependentiae bacterium]